jgi:hypothetical protein
MASAARPKPGSEEELPLSKAAEQLLEECRMVLPGIQALFGFQLIAVFNQGFSTKLTEGMQRLHLAAIVLTCIAIALIMSPAAYQRQTSPKAVSEDFIRLSSRLLVASMFPLAASISVEVFLVGSIVLHSAWAVVIAVAALFLFLGFWFVLPWRRRAR